ncbi:SpoIIE family protein phosphatase [Embleya sp. NPDC050154]|uniref:SpoIIE family protein phosphatase n=1 Tax=Embleya sp. NPDC050154 TaxID=3363988 RepID=UPI003798DDB9
MTRALEPGAATEHDPMLDDGPATVLVVDDTETKRYIIGSWLRRAGHRVLEAETGAQALDVAFGAADHGDPVDVAIVDVRLPDTSGFEVCERLKSDVRTASMPVVHVSASAITVSDRAQGLYRGADAYLIDPIEPEVLLATLQAALRYSRARRRAEHRVSVLSELARATMLVNAAGTLEELGNAIATGASLISRAPAASYIDGPGDSARRTVIGEYGVEPKQANVPPALFDALSRFTDLGEATGSTSVEITAEEWLRTLPDSLASGPVHLSMCRTKTARPPTALAVPADAARHPEERQALRELARTGALAVEAFRSYAREHALALDLQRSFLPSVLPVSDLVDIAVRYRPASDEAEIGGDFYEAVAIEDRLLVAIGDVAGHSLHAATIMGELRHGLRAYASDGHEPDAILERLNTMLTRYHRYETATVCVLMFDPRTGVIDLANAGHLPPLVLTEDGHAHYLVAGGPLLGLELPRPGTTRFELPEKATLLLYTDGLVEERGSDLDEGMERLRAETVRETTPRTDLAALADHLLSALQGDERDDIALLLLRRTG